MFPVKCHTDDDQPELILRWIGAVHDVSGDSDQVWFFWFPEDETSKPKELDGPVIVKLNGAPLHALPHATQLDITGYDVISHAITISESDYLQNVVLFSMLPDFVVSVLREQRRSLFFFGHPAKIGM